MLMQLVNGPILIARKQAIAEYSYCSNRNATFPSNGAYMHRFGQISDPVDYY